MLVAFTAEDFEEFAKPGLVALPPPIIEKVQSSASILSKIPSNIPREKYQHVYAIGDIHADLPKLITVLVDNGIIDFNMDNLPAFRTNLHNVNWVKPNTLIVLVGDIVDGRRIKTTIPLRYTDIPDTIGNIELLLHAFIYNLRISASEKGSDLIFVSGNHDYHTILLSSEAHKDTIDYMYNNYVHEKAKEFFGNYENRRTILLPFYTCCPYLIITIDSEVAFVHAGLYSSDANKKSVYERLMGIQNSIHTEMLEDGIQHISEVINKDEFTVFLFGGGLNGPLWSRDYLKKSKGETCGSLGKEVNGVDLTIVGHCPTYKPSADDIYHNELLDLPKYVKKGCKPPGGHCVLVGCEDGNGPHIAFTDVGLTRAFSQVGDGKTENLRRIEILRIEHTEEGGAEGKYFNNIFTESTKYIIDPKQVSEVDIITQMLPHETIQEWAPTENNNSKSPPFFGGRRLHNRKTRRRKNKSKRKYTRRH
jgi:hypothetical protein